MYHIAMHIKQYVRVSKMFCFDGGNYMIMGHGGSGG